MDIHHQQIIVKLNSMQLVLYSTVTVILES